MVFGGFVEVAYCVPVYHKRSSIPFINFGGEKGAIFIWCVWLDCL